MIAIMVNNQPLLNKKNQTTLIVVPSSIVNQWLSEIAKHTEDHIMENIYIYKSGARILGDDPCRRLRTYSVVITTYNEVRALSGQRCAPSAQLTVSGHETVPEM